MRVSVVMPAFNAERFVEEAVRGVLAQTFRDLQLIIVDDGSTDGTLVKVKGIADSRLTLIENGRNLGASVSRNKAIAATDSEWIAVCDADDVWLPGKLEAQLRFLDGNPEVDLVGTAAVVIDETGRELERFTPPCTHGLMLWDLLIGPNPVVHSSVLVRRSHVVRVGGYAPLTSSYDRDLWSRLLPEARLSNLSACHVRYRRHRLSSTGQHRSTQLSESLRTRAKTLRRLTGIDVPVGLLESGFAARLGRSDIEAMSDLILKLHSWFIRRNLFEGEEETAILARTSRRILQLALRDGSVPPEQVTRAFLGKLAFWRRW